MLCEQIVIERYEAPSGRHEPVSNPKWRVGWHLLGNQPTNRCSGRFGMPKLRVPHVNDSEATRQ
jgi:hypothetical protein